MGRDLINGDFTLENSSGASWYVSEELEILIGDLDKMFEVQDFVTLTPGDLALMNSSLAQYAKDLREAGEGEE